MEIVLQYVFFIMERMAFYSFSISRLVNFSERKLSTFMVFYYLISLVYEFIL